MARNPKDLVSAKALGKVFTAAHKKAGKPSYDAISREVYARTGEEVSGEHIRRIISGEVDPNTIDLNDLMALANYLRVPHSKLPAVAIARLERNRDLHASSLRWITTHCDDQLELRLPPSSRAGGRLRAA